MSTNEEMAARLAAEMNIAPSDALTSDVAAADALCAAYIDGHADRFTTEQARALYERAVLKAAAELYEQRKAPNGVRNFADMDGSTVIRVARDPMVAARPLLAALLPLATS